MFIIGVIDTGDKLLASVNDSTGDKLSLAAEVDPGRRYCHWT
jgi:hypothetical protein